MRKGTKAERGAGAEREVKKAEVRKLFGMRYIGERVKRLCSVCPYRPTCLLYPVTTKGEDCPYFPETVLEEKGGKR